MKRLITWLRSVLVLLLGLILLCSLSASVLLYGSLPQYDGKKHQPNLTQPVTVERDVLGSVTLTGQHRLDLANALGFVHAQERFFEMDLMRRQGAGELAEIFGEDALPLDLETRKYRMRARAKQILQQLPDDQQQLLTAYRIGVNNGLSSLSVRPYPYLLTRTKPAPWHEEDTLLVVFAMFITLNQSTATRELALSVMRSALPDDLFRFLTASGGSWDTPLIGDTLEWPPIPDADTVDLSNNKIPPLSTASFYNEFIPGSNNFAVSGKLANGAALVANDMHLTLRVPNIWFRTRLIQSYKNTTHATAKQLDINGLSLPGIPLIIIGSNRHIAWSFTNSYGDFIDWVRVTLDPEDTSRYRGSSGWQPIQHFQETIHIRNASAKQITVQETEWGPLVTHDHDGVPLAIAWTALQSNSINLNLIGLEHAQTVNDAATIAQQTGMPAQNFIVGDKNGNILWTIAGRIPLRASSFDPKLPASWANSGTGWQGWLDPADYPLIRNPESGRLWTANARAIDLKSLAILGDGGYDLGARSRQIRDRLFARDQFTADDLKSIQLDHRAIFYDRWHSLLMDNLFPANNVSYRQIEAILKDWDGLAAADSVAYRIVRNFRKEVTKTILNILTATIKERHPSFIIPRLSQVEHAIWRLIETQPAHILPANYENWSGLIKQCVQRTITHLQNQSEDITQRTWGEDNAAHIKHPLSQHLPKWLSHYLDMPADPLSGDIHMPRIQTPSFGASQRSVVAPGNEEAGHLDMPGGQSGHPLSPYYGSGHEHWVTGKPTPFLPGKAERTLTLIP